MLLCCHLPEHPNDALTARLLALSEPARLARTEALPAQKRAASLAAELLVRLGQHRLGLVPASLIRLESGAPCLENSALFVSLSHSGSYAACALSTQPIGVDVQQIVPASRRLSERICTQDERAALERSPDALRDLIRLWALKEAYFKAAGGGHSFAVMRAASFSLFPDSSAPSGPAGWRFRLFDLPEETVLAACEREA